MAKNARRGQNAGFGPFGSGLLVVSLLSVWALLVHGYHPWAEDGGLYAAGVKRLLDPRLYPREKEFVTEHLRFSVFAPVVAWGVRASHLPLEWVLLIFYVGGIWFTLYAGWELASRCFASTAARCGGVALLACWLTLPLAGTSLMLMDPYVTARTLSTPLTTFALCWVLDGLAGDRRAWWLCAGALGLAAAVHPLMAGYGVVGVVLLACAGNRSRAVRVWGSAAVAVAGVVVAGAVQLRAAADPGDAVRVAMTRYYWFPGQWEWYERVGLVAPLVLLGGILMFKDRRVERPERDAVVRMALVLGGLAIGIAAIFSRARLAAHAVARLQPLRSFQTVYVVMIVMVGAVVGEYLLKKRSLRWVVFAVVAGAPMYVAQRNIFPASLHLELPWRASPNGWVEAFVWIRETTPREALFALDPHYITTDGEDAQGFRAIAERSALPDYSKDGGEASITPELVPAWVEGQKAQGRLNEESDAERSLKLQPLGVGWVVLRAGAATGFACPYSNRVVKVCRLP